MRLARACVLLVLFALLAGGVQAQNSREAERKLAKVNQELKSVAAERRKLEGQRGEASRDLRRADEEVGRSSRSLREVEQALAAEEHALAGLHQRRDALQAGLGDKRAELARLLRAAYRVGEDAPLKALLSQDGVADGQRALAYHGYLQRDRIARIRTLTAELQQVDTLQQQIEQRRDRLAATRRQQRTQLAELEAARKQRAALVATLDQRYSVRAAREKALGRDAKALQRLLAQLRAAAAKAEAARRAAASKPKLSSSGAATRNAVASAPALQVGGLSWPVSGSLLASYGGTLPDGRGSEGVLIAANAGTTVKAVADGQVVFADWMNGYGLILIVDHGNGYMSLYAHNDALLRDAGDAVQRGDAVATVGNSGGQGRAALYFELRRNGKPVDPGSWLQRR
jgi:septal ring factor EnvC (AmiA/AmiB activator)